MAKIMQHGDRVLYTKPIQLDYTKTSGYQVVSIPTAVGYIAVLNESGAYISYAPGELFQQPPDAVTVNPNVYLSLPMQETNKITIFWSGSISAQNNNLNLLFSNEEITVQGGAMTTGGVSQNVSVTNSPTVQIGGTPNVNATITTYPSSMAQDGTDATGVTPPAGAAGIRGWLSGLFNLFNAGTAKVNATIGTDSVGLAKDGTDGTGITQPTGGVGIRGWLSGIYNLLNAGTAQVKLMAGTNSIGKVDISGANLVQALTQGIISNAQQSIATTATQVTIPSSGIKHVTIQNLDASNPIYLGKDNTVASTTGLKVSAGGSYEMEIVPGSTITVWAIATGAAVNVAVVGVN